MKCPNKNTEEWKLLVDNLGEIDAYKVFVANNDNLPNLEGVNKIIDIHKNAVNYNLKLVKSLFDISDNRLTIKTNTKDKPYIEKNISKQLAGLGVPNNQINLMFDYMKSNNIQEISTKELALELASKYSYTVEVNTAKGKVDITKINFNDPDNYDEAYENQNEVGLNKPTQYYSNLTVPGGTNYTENEISTPLITPSIKGHAQFSTDKGIGWFRSDDLSYSNQKEKETKDFSTDFAESSLLTEESFTYNGDKYELVKEFEPGLGAYTMRTKNGESISHEVFMEALENKRLDFNKTNPKTRRILEVQSDLFQKGRDKKVLSGEEDQIGADIDEAIEAIEERVKEGSFTREYADNEIKKLKAEQNSKENQFLQLLNKDNNWITFFIKSIIQDTAKQTITEVQESDVEAKIRELEKEGLLEIDCKGKLKAEKGLQTNFTKGGKWRLIKDLKNYPTHKEGGVDLTIGKNGVSIKNGNAEFTAKHGLVIPKN